MNQNDDPVVTALLKRFTEQRLPKAMELREKVFAGEKLNGLDIAFLNDVFEDSKFVMKFTDKYPEFREIATKAVQLYTEITEKALENEKAQ